MHRGLIVRRAVLQEMLQDEDEGTADAVRVKLDAYPEVRQ